MFKAYPKRVLWLAALAFIAIILISFFKAALELEDAEQAYYSQWWRLGYDDQPPLYTWLQIIMTKVFGVSRFALAGQRAIFFASTLLLMYRFAHQMLNDKKLAEISVWSMALIIVFIDFNFRRLSHTSMMCALVLATLVITDRLLHSENLKNYILLGITLGLGMLTKYNFAIFITSLLVAALLTRKTRLIVFNPKIIISLVLCMILFAPHGYWLLSEQAYIIEIQNQVNDKANITEKDSMLIVPQLWEMTKRLLIFWAPLLTVLFLGYLSKHITFKNVAKKDWFFYLLWVQVIFLTILFAALKVENIEERWLLPLMLPFVVFIIRYIDIASIETLSRIGFIVFLTAIGIQTIRTPIEKMLSISSAVHYSFDPIVNVLETKPKAKQWVLPDVTSAGGVYFIRPHREVISMDDFTLPEESIDSSNAIFIFKTKNNKLQNTVLFDSIIDFGDDHEDYFFYMTKNAQ
ncbi:ArnT family glycosyltransferase [Sungkyunkwania multivorans]|uniref:ArnT family glycosyltransferase n=1 Tax=Sungkyunkwania multivorans TaxID=1173618 RepID=A0ABW3D2G4_9FLAO